MFVMNVSCHMCFDSSAAMQPHRPIGSPPKGATKWEPVVLRASLGFTGGYQNKHYSLVTETVSTDQGDQHFVTVKKMILGFCMRAEGLATEEEISGDPQSWIIILRQKAVEALGSAVAEPNDDNYHDANRMSNITCR